MSSPTPTPSNAPAASTLDAQMTPAITATNTQDGAAAMQIDSDHSAAPSAAPTPAATPALAADSAQTDNAQPTPIPAAATSVPAAASPSSSPAPPSASAEPAAAASAAEGEVDDDALLAEALAEAEEEEEEGDTDDEAAAPASASSTAAPAAAAELTPLEAAAKAAGLVVPPVAGAPVPGETYISESGEVLRSRAPRKKKVVEKTVVDVAADEADAKARAERAETLLTNLLRRTNEVMTRTMEGAPATAAAQAAAAASSRKKKRDEAPRRKSEKEEDELLLNDLEDAGDTLPNGALQLRSQPSIITGKMRDYQLEGLNWMARLYHSGVSGILADEMGLGKTLQAISLLAYLRQFQKLNGPHLVLVPLSTLGNWHREFTRWCPSIRCFRFHGTKEERAAMVASGQLKPENWDVLLTSYEMSIREKAHINKVKWNFIIVDEAHRLKNEGSLLSQIVRIFSSRNRLLLTGTPLQNNLQELWALLNFLLPEIFSSSSDFDEMFSAAQTDANVSTNLLAQLHKVLRPFMLRRLKSQVATDLPPKKETLLFVGMSEMQTKLYKGILEKDIEAVMGRTTQKSRLMNMVMQLRKAANHPYLFEGVEDRSLPAYGDHLIYTSGKMSVMDKLLARFKQQGSRVLIFSQMTRTLDIMEDYCLFRQFNYCRIDGATAQEDRETMMRDFNAEGSDKFLFLLSTRAGGLGINLNTADIVILYDSDWNPQMDLQAMDRAHRIGQKKKVFVYRLITENTIEEKIIERAEIKLRLDAMVIQQGRGAPKAGAGAAGGAAGKASGTMSSDEMSAMIRFGADRIFKQTGSTITNEDIDNILQTAEARTQEIQSKLGKHVGLLDLSLDGAPPMMLPDENQGDLPLDELERQMLLNMHDSMGKRDRKGKSYDERVLGQVPGAPPIKTHLPRPYKIPRMPDYQLFNSKRIMELSEKEKAWFDKHCADASAPAVRGGLTAAEDTELQALLAEGFVDWSMTDYSIFLDACKRYGGRTPPSAIEKVISALEGRKTREQVVQYHRAFFDHAPRADGFKSALLGIARGEARVKKFAEFEDMLERALQGYPAREDVMERLPIPYAAALHKGKGFTLQEDRFLLYVCRLLGYGEWQKLQWAIRRDGEFRFDYFLKTRSLTQINRRVDALLRAMSKVSKAKGGVGSKSGADLDNIAPLAPGSGGGARGRALGARGRMDDDGRPSPSPSPSPFGIYGAPAGASSRASGARASPAVGGRGGGDGMVDEIEEHAGSSLAVPRASPNAVLLPATLSVLRRAEPASEDHPLSHRRLVLLQAKMAIMSGAAVTPAHNAAAAAAAGQTVSAGAASSYPASSAAVMQQQDDDSGSELDYSIADDDDGDDQSQSSKKQRTG